MIRLTDYQIAEAFGGILSGIYKSKVGELNNNLQPVYDHLDRLDQPKYSEFQRWFARQCIPDNAKRDLKAIEHINRIRGLYKKMKKTPEIERYELNIQKAKSVPIESLYNFENRKKNMVSCPFHPDHSPSMKINKDNTCKCFSCGFFGDSVGFFMKLNSVGFKEVVQQLEKM